MDAATCDKRLQRMLDEIARDARETANWTGRLTFSERTVRAMEEVPRHLFVADRDADAGYVNRPLRIGHGQTISQPFIVALMTDFLNLKGDEQVLEVGTGCGYQTAVLATALEAGHVHTLEVIDALVASATTRLKDQGYDNVSVRHGDGFQGWPEAAPFDAIIVTAAPDHVPVALTDQLKPSGRMVLPVGRPHDRQILTLIGKDGNGQLRTEKILPVAFVPMIGKNSRN